MRSFLRFLLGLIILIILAIIILGIVEPKDVIVQRSVNINAPQNVVFDQIVKFKNWPHWSPWYQMEPSVQLTYSGNDGEVGSSYHWVGKKTGEGTMENAGVKNNNELDYVLHFIKPFKSTATGFLKAVDTAGQTKATWSFTTHYTFPFNASLAFINMDKMLGSDFEKGLANLKKYCEGAAATSGGTATIQEVQFPGHIYAGIRQNNVSWNDMNKFFSDAYGQLGNKLGSYINGPAAGLFYKWDTANHTGDIAAAFPIADSSKKINSVTYINVPASKAYMIPYKGGYNGIGSAHNALGQRLMSENKKMSLVIEEYVNGPYQDKDSTKWLTNVYYLYQ